jgi:hypothetical protein
VETANQSTATSKNTSQSSNISTAQSHATSAVLS